MSFQRIPEPELMDDDEQAEAYANADFSQVNQAFVDRLVGWLPGAPDTIVDLGCGPADIPIRLCQALPEARVTGMDGSAAMLALARSAAEQAGLGDRLELVERALPGPETTTRYDAVISNSLLHHLHDPRIMWREVLALAKPGASLFVMDLFRPDTKEAAQAIVDEHADGEHPVLRRDFYNSLLAAFTIEEVTVQLVAAGLASAKVEAISDRHLLVTGQVN